MLTTRDLEPEEIVAASKIFPDTDKARHALSEYATYDINIMLGVSGAISVGAPETYTPTADIPFVDVLTLLVEWGSVDMHTLQRVIDLAVHAKNSPKTGRFGMIRNRIRGMLAGVLQPKTRHAKVRTELQVQGMTFTPQGTLKRLFSFLR